MLDLVAAAFEQPLELLVAIDRVRRSGIAVVVANFRDTDTVWEAVDDEVESLVLVALGAVEVGCDAGQSLSQL